MQDSYYKVIWEIFDGTETSQFWFEEGSNEYHLSFVCDAYKDNLNSGNFHGIQPWVSFLMALKWLLSQFKAIKKDTHGGFP